MYNLKLTLGKLKVESQSWCVNFMVKWQILQEFSRCEYQDLQVLNLYALMTIHTVYLGKIFISVVFDYLNSLIAINDPFWAIYFTENITEKEYLYFSRYK